MVSTDSIQYQIRPAFEEKFKKTEIEEVVRVILDEKFENMEYSGKLANL